MNSKQEQLEQAMAKVQELQEQANKEAFDTLEHARDTLESNLHLEVYEGKTQKIAKLEQFIRDDVFKISGRQLPEEFFEDETTKGRIWHFLMQESEY